MKTIGIIGGMGPKSTVNIFDKIVQLTPIKVEQDHIPILIYNNPKIPDRTTYILNKNAQNPLPLLIDTAKTLQNAGADILIIACNTAHYFYEQIKEAISIPFLNMIEETAKECIAYDKVVLFSTQGTYSSGIYDKAFAQYNIQVIKPSDNIKEQINTLIYQYKKGDSCIYSPEIISFLDEHKEYPIILGCTELPILFKDYGNNNFIDPIYIISKKAVEYSINS